MNVLTTISRLVLVGFSCCLFFSACTYEQFADAPYPQQILYMPAARNGVFTINSVATTGAYKFTVKLDEKKLVIPLSVFRGRSGY